MAHIPWAAMVRRSMVHLWGAGASVSVAGVLLAGGAHAQDLVVSSGSTLVYDTSNGPIVVQNLIIEPDGTLRAHGLAPLRVFARRSVQVDGTLDLSGFDNPGVNTLNTTSIPEGGARGGPGAGRGGTGSLFTTQSSPKGGDGFGPRAAARRGGGGGESGYSPVSPQANARRPGGGGGGALAADQPVNPDPDHPANRGLLARRGRSGAQGAVGVLLLQSPPSGGVIGQRPFVDSDPLNDFFGRKLDPATGTLIYGELARPVAGAGGGGGGDAIHGQVWPPPMFDPGGDEKGAGGGGGGGLGIIVSPRIRLGALGLVRCDGGRGGGGENVSFIDRVGGGSGGGSGGYLILQARLIDLSAASDRSIRALGGRGGVGMNDNHDMINAGGNGGPGVIAFHLPNGLADVLLPAGKTLAELTAPLAHLLLPEPGL